MAPLGQTTRNRSRKNLNPDRKPNYALYVWLFFLFVTFVSGVYVSIKAYYAHINPTRIYGEWTEIGAPSWSTDKFTLSPEGVTQESRFISSSFEFDGSVVSFYTGGEQYEYEVFGSNSERLKRVAGGGHAASFIKQGYEHTLPKQDNIGPARRVSLAEHFKSLK